MGINEIGEKSHEINKSNGWDVFHPSCWQDKWKTTAHMALVTSEVSEAVEAIRAKDINNFAEEMADAVIRISSIMHGLGFDLEKEILTKLEKNRQRGFRHGGKAL